MKPPILSLTATPLILRYSVAPFQRIKILFSPTCFVPKNYWRNCVLFIALGISACATANDNALSNKDKAVALIHSIESGDIGAVEYINPNRYIQHNLNGSDGTAGISKIIQNAPKSGNKAEVVRAFEDGDYVVTHSKYHFFGPKAGFDIFRFEDGKIVEHWDNLEPIAPPNRSGHTQFDGETVITDVDKTEANKQLVTDFYQQVVIGRDVKKFPNYINAKNYIQHNPNGGDGVDGIAETRKIRKAQGITMKFTRLHKVLGKGNFVLAVTEGLYGKDGGKPAASYDLFRLENGKIVEHWDTIQAIPPKAEHKNSNGKFGF